MVPMCRARLVELKATGQLPSPTGVALAIMRLTQNEGVNVGELVQALESDPAMVGRLLKLANSAVFSSARRITTVQEAVTRLGLRTVRNLALGFSLIRRNGSASCSEFDYQRFWSVSLARAVAAQVLGARQPHVKAGEAFVCGLLCDVGTLALASIYSAAYARILLHARNANTPMAVAEQEEFAIDHQELTVALLEDWGLPSYFGEAVRHREHPCPEHIAGDAITLELARLLYAADHLAELCLAEEEDRALLMTELFKRCRELSIAPDDVITLGDSAVAQWQEWGKILEVVTCVVPSFAELSARSQEQPSEDCYSTPTDDVPAAGPLQIMVASSDANLLQDLKGELESAGHKALTASDGQEALRTLVEHEVQIILADCDMSPLNGSALCKVLRETKIGRQMYVILLTDPAYEQREADCGADDFLTKPVQQQQLLTRLRAAERVIRVQHEAIQDKEELARFAAELAVTNRTLLQAAYADPLTGLPNRRYILERLHEEWANATRRGHALTCMIVDIDRFKLVNDTYGHDVGDLVLQEIAGVLRGALRGNDFVGRLGGEEFIVLCPKTDRKGAWQCAERLRRSVEDRVISTPNGPRHITISIGVSLKEAGTPNSDEMLKEADRAVYGAKRAGRNVVCLADTLTAEPLDCRA